MSTKTPSGPSHPYSSTQPSQWRKADFGAFWPNRVNGWNDHVCVFDANIEEHFAGHAKSPVFRYDASNGNLHICREGHLLKLELWWKGRAPWGYHFLCVVRNASWDKSNEQIVMPDLCGLSDEDCRRDHSSPFGDIAERACAKSGYWGSSNGHLVVWIPAVVGDIFNTVNKPAHIQGTPACFEFRVSAYRMKPTIHPAPPMQASSIDSIKHLHNMIHHGTLTTTDAKEILKRNPTWRYISDDSGTVINELLLSHEISGGHVYSSSQWSEFKNLFCINAHAHQQVNGILQNNPTPNVRAHGLCWSCKEPVESAAQALEKSEINRVRLEDEELFGIGISSNPDTFERASIASSQRGVSVRWLEHFTNMHNCWSWPTWRVVQNIVKPATAHSRCRYVHLPGISAAAQVGPVDIFISHSWGGVWGDLVAAALQCIEQVVATDDDDEVLQQQTIVRVYVDIFAVRQWPGNICDVVFAGVVKRARTVLVVVSGGELQRIAELNFKDLIDQGLAILQPNERRGIPFLRIWCLAEISCACLESKPLVIACGSWAQDMTKRQATGNHIFVSNTPLLYHMQFLVSVADAEAQYEEDRLRILDEVQRGVGFDEVNRRVRGAIVGSMACSKSPVLTLASIGMLSPLLLLLNDCFSDTSKPNPQLLPQVIDAFCAAAAGGYLDLFDLVVDVSSTQFELWSAADRDGMTALMNACRGGHHTIVEKIICSVGDSQKVIALVNRLNNDQWSAIAFAAQFGSASIIETLIANKAAVNQSLNGGQTPLSIGCQSNFSVECCKLLLAAGASVNHRDGVGYTALRHAVTPGGTPENVVAILKAGADPNAVDNWGESILLWACEGTIAAMVKLLEFDVSAAHNGSPTIYSNCEVNAVHFERGAGQSALDKVKQRNDVNMEKLLLSWGALTAEEIVRRSPVGGCGKMVESNVQLVMKSFRITREEAGLALSIFKGRIDHCLESGGSFPKPGQIVSISTMCRSGNRWLHGIVTRGGDWDASDDVDGGPMAVGYLVGLDRKQVDDGKVWVVWPLSCNSDGKRSYHRAGADGKFDLVYAGYHCTL